MQTKNCYGCKDYDKELTVELRISFGDEIREYRFCSVVCLINEFSANK